MFKHGAIVVSSGDRFILATWSGNFDCGLARNTHMPRQ
jgi:hypothetical protein